ncbi:MAG: hypothetical protein IJ438_04945 [Clostridia bacterium]|nr:hypothetical protein [Clostridia bacterium]
MTLVERIAEETRTMPVHSQQQVPDFVQLLEQKEQRRLQRCLAGLFDDSRERG